MPTNDNLQNIELLNSCPRQGPDPSDFNSRVKLSVGQNWIDFGTDNAFLEKLVELFENSPTHGAIINKKTNYTAGESLVVENEETERQLAKLNSEKGLFRLIKAAARDYHLFGGFCLQVIFYRNRRAIKDILYHDFTQVRRGFSPDTEGLTKEEIREGKRKQGVWITQNWQRKYRYRPQFYELFNQKMLTGEMEIPTEPVFLYFYKDTPGREWYPLPDYHAGISAIFSEIEAQSFIFHQFKNSFNPSGILRLPNRGDASTQQQTKQQLQEDLQGSVNVGRLISVFEDDEVEWIPISDTMRMDGLLEIQDRNQRMIITAHEITSPALVGLPSGPSLGGDGTTIDAAAQEFYNMTILPAQTQIFETIDLLLKHSDIDYQIEIIESYLYIKNKNE